MDQRENQNHHSSRRTERFMQRQPKRQPSHPVTSNQIDSEEYDSNNEMSHATTCLPAHIQSWPLLQALLAAHRVPVQQQTVMGHSTLLTQMQQQILIASIAFQSRGLLSSTTSNAPVAISPKVPTTEWKIPRNIEVQPLEMKQVPSRKQTTNKERPIKQVVEADSTTTVPCKARGMSPDHTFQIAHFFIHSNVKHGEELKCSHATCRSGGIKFCYCSHCKIPVAKRNFRIRHHHFDAAPLPTAGSDVYERLQNEEITEMVASDMQPSREVAAQRHISMKASSLGVTASSGTLPPSAASDPPSPGSVAPVQRSTVTIDSDGQSSIMKTVAAGKTSLQEVTKKEAVQTHHEEKLLFHSPKITGAESEDGFFVPGSPAHSQFEPADLGIAAVASERINADPSDDLMEAWDQLLNKRPRKSNRNAMSSWLIQVLSVSDLDTPIADGSSMPQKREKHTGPSRGKEDGDSVPSKRFRR